MIGLCSLLVLNVLKILPGHDDILKKKQKVLNTVDENISVEGHNETSAKFFKEQG